ncbi:hypothetical protein [Pedobacter cryoconitis]|uniref:Carboxypeptidase-like protein n=1 Tax=Pedobacter cryoconitis TaxID=188932 RepID=A0A7X0J3R0_9SPHI|nr:hypothetical protein [Pedobacter cryoconitis]MBB6500325.1 hypothetical protein [Pedobacter cryoconitis]
MFRKLVFLLLISIFSLAVHAQQVQGTVADRATQLRLGQVEVLNQQTRQKTMTNAKGEFTIAAAVNQVLVFNQPGYLPDTLFLVDLKPVKRYLSLNNRLLHTVEIKAGAFHPEIEYADVYSKARVVQVTQNKPFMFSLTRIFAKEGKDARRFKRKLEREKTERKIDERFNEAAVKALTPLKGAELDYFMVLYRPSLKDLNKLDQEDFRFYLMNAYKTFKALPPEQRISPSMRDK